MLKLQSMSFRCSFKLTVLSSSDGSVNTILLRLLLLLLLLLLLSTGFLHIATTTTIWTHVSTVAKWIANRRRVALRIYKQLFFAYVTRSSQLFLFLLLLKHQLVFLHFTDLHCDCSPADHRSQITDHRSQSNTTTSQQRNYNCFCIIFSLLSLPLSLFSLCLFVSFSLSLFTSFQFSFHSTSSISQPFAAFNSNQIVTKQVSLHLANTNTPHHQHHH